MSLAALGHTGTPPAPTAAQRIPGRGSYKDPSRDVARQAQSHDPDECPHEQVIPLSRKGNNP